MISRVSSRTFIFLSACAAFVMVPAHAQESGAEPAQEMPANTASPNASTEPTPEAARSKEERNQMEQRAKELKAAAKKIKEEAQQRKLQADKDCWNEILVSRCIEKARLAQRDEDRIARQMQREGNLLERNVKRFDAAENAAQREAANAKKDAEIAKKEAKSKK